MFNLFLLLLPIDISSNQHCLTRFKGHGRRFLFAVTESWTICSNMTYIGSISFIYLLSSLQAMKLLLEHGMVHRH